MLSTRTSAFDDNYKDDDADHQYYHGQNDGVSNYPPLTRRPGFQLSSDAAKWTKTARTNAVVYKVDRGMKNEKRKERLVESKGKDQDTKTRTT